MPNTAFIAPVLCPTNSNRHSPFLLSTESPWPRQEATLHCFSDIILPLNYRNSLVSIIFLAFHIPDGSFDETQLPGVWMWLKRPTQDQQHLPTAWDGPLPRCPTASRTGTELFSHLRVIWPSSAFCPGPFLSNRTHCMLSGQRPWLRAEFSCVDFSTINIGSEL